MAARRGWRARSGGIAVLVDDHRRRGNRVGPLTSRLLLQLAADLGDLPEAELAGVLGKTESGRHLLGGGRHVEQGELLGGVGAVR